MKTNCVGRLRAEMKMGEQAKVEVIRLTWTLLLLSATFTLARGAVRIRCQTQDGSPTVYCSKDQGTCNTEGKCVCLPCWKGANCSLFVNKHPPTFAERQYVTAVKSTVSSGEMLVVVKAEDGDGLGCYKNQSCPCATVLYSILSGNNNSIFTINPSNGAISLSYGAQLKSSKNYLLTIGAKNPLSSSYPNGSTTLLIVQVEKSLVVHKEDNKQADYHIRHRRAVQANVPKNITFTLKKTGLNENVTTLKQGMKVAFRLLIHFSSGPTDMLVELFTPDINETIMILCNPRITHIGSNIKFSGQETPKMDSKDGSTLFDRAIFNLGNVNNSILDESSPEPSMVYIDYEVTMISNKDDINNSVHWISAGAEYNQENEVWVGQASYLTLQEKMTITKQPVFNLSGPSEIAIDSSAAFEITMNIPSLVTDLKVDAFAPLNRSSAMSVCSLHVFDMGKNYECLPRDHLKYQLFKDSSGKGNSRGHLNIGTIVNTGIRLSSYDPQEDYIIVKFVMHMNNDSSLVGNQFWIGAAVEIGSKQIWAGQMLVTASDTTPQAINSEDVSFSVSSNKSKVAILETSSFSLDILIKENSTATYELEVVLALSISGEANFQLCHVGVLFKGSNIPCVTEKVDYSSQGDSVQYDKAVLKLGQITNIGLYNGTANSSVNLLRIQIVLTPLNITTNTAGSSQKVSSTVKYGSHTWTNVHDLEIVDPVQSSLNITPSFNLKFSFDDGYVPINAATEIILNVTTVSGAFYPVMKFEVVTPYDNITGAMLTTCQINFKHIGKNFPCLHKEKTESLKKYTSWFGDEKYDKAEMNFGPLCNFGFHTGSDDNTLTIAIRVKVQDHLDLNNGTKQWVSTGLHYEALKMWVGQIALWTLRDQPSDFPMDKDVLIFLIPGIKNQTLTPVGLAIPYNLTVKVPPQSTINLKVNVESVSSFLSICAIKIYDVGSSLGCINRSQPAHYSQHQGSSLYKKIELDMGPVSNLASDKMVNSSDFDNTALVFDLVFMLDNKTGEGLSGDVVVTLYYSNAQKWTDTVVLTATHDMSRIVLSSLPLQNVATNIDAIAGNDTNSLITWGQAKRVITQFEVPLNLTQKVRMKSMVPNLHINQIEICSIRVYSVGENIACIDKGKLLPTLESTHSSSRNYSGVLDLGYICNRGYNTNDSAANRVEVETIVHLPVNSTLVQDGAVEITTVVFPGDQAQITATTTLTITNTFESMITEESNSTINASEILLVNITDDPITMGVGELRTIPVILFIAANSSLAVIADINLTVEDSALMTVASMKYVSAGRNIACLGTSEEFQATYVSSLNTTQNNKATIDFKVVSNTGITYRTGDFTEADNQILLEIIVQMTDNSKNSHLSGQWISFGAKIGVYIILIQKRVTTVRNNDERPYLLLTANINDTSVMPISSGVVKVDGILKHENISRAEGQSVLVMFYIPYYLDHTGVISSNLTTSNVVYNKTVLKMTFDRLFFTDIAAFSFNLRRNPAANATWKHSLINVTVPFEAGTNMIHRANSIYARNTFFATSMDYICVSVQLPSSGDTACENALGMESKQILDCQITASPESLKIPQNGRFNIGSGWSPFIREGKFAAHRYMQIYFGNKTLVRKLKLGKPAYSPADVTSLKLRYSNDGKGWINGEVVTVTPPYPDSIKLMKPRESRYLRLYILNSTLSPTTEVGITVEFFGCVKSSDVASASICSSTVPTSTDWYNRGFLVAGETIFVCDANPNDELKLNCFSSADGKSWRVLDKRVANVVGYDQDKTRLFGIAKDKKSHVISNDNGLTWTSANPHLLANTRTKAGFITAKSVPWNTSVLSDPTSFIMENWKATLSGIHFKGSGSWEKMADWSTCCTS